VALFERISQFEGLVFRNITSLRQSQDLFDDLIPDQDGRRIALAAEMRMRTAPPGIIERGLAYSEAVDYPFTSDNTVNSRYGDGTVRVWYGALDEETSLAETCWHQIKQIQAIEGVSIPVIRYRAIYQVMAKGLFLELRGKELEFPELLDEDYAATQAIGKHVASEGLGGILYPSARWPDGNCLAAFRADPLSNPVLMYYLTYRIDPVAGAVTIERAPGVIDRILSLPELRRHR